MWDSITDASDSFWSDFSTEVLSTVAVIIGALIVLALLKRSIHRWEDRVQLRFNESEDQADRERGQRLVTLADIGSVIVSVTVWAVVMLTIMAIWGIPMAPFVAIGATIGIAIGFGAQDFVKDVIAGFLILVEDQYSIGDVVTLSGVSGTVEAIKLRTTVLRDLQGNQHHVPNGHIGVSSNLTSDFARLVVDVPVAYDTDLDDAIDVISDEANRFSQEDEWSGRFLAEPQMLGVNKLDDSSINIRLLMTLTTEDRWTVKRAFLLRLKKRLDLEGIEIPFQYMTVIMRKEEN
jgi:small-conductance mechanosensitive channel